MKQLGFTLTEMIVTASIAAILIAVGIPSFRSVACDSRIATKTNEFISSLNLARSEAIKRRLRVTVCRRSTDGDVSCRKPNRSLDTESGFEQGWLVFVDSENDGRFIGETRSNDILLRIFEKMPTDITFKAQGNPGNGVPEYVSFTADGLPREANKQAGVSGAFQAGTYQICSCKKARTITLSRLGRIVVKSLPSCS